MDAESILYDELERMGSGGEIKNPDTIWSLLEIFPQLTSDYQVILIEQLEKIARSLLHNPNLIMSESKSAKKDVLNSFMSLALTSSDMVQGKIICFIELLVSSVGVKKSNTQFIFQFLASQSLTEEQLSTCIRILQILISPNKPPAPYSYFYFSGPGSGLDINFEKYPAFAFQKGFSACFWLRVEDVSSDKPSRLMSFHSRGSGGIEAYFIKNRLYYRLLGPEYSLPELGSNGILLNEFQPETWTFLGIEHEKTKLRKSVLKVVVDGEEIMSPPVDFPVLKGHNPEFSLAGLCLDFTGQLACAMIFSDVISVSSMKTIHSFYTYAPQGHEALRSLHRVIDKNISKNLFCFYHPVRVHERTVYDGMAKYDARLIGLSGSKHLLNTRMNYLGGICALLPIVDKISQQKANHNFLFAEWVKLFSICLRDRPENQIEACKMKFFKALAEILMNFPPQDLKEEIIDFFEELNNFIMPQLRDQMTLHLLWLPEFWSKTSSQVQSKLYKVLKVLYSKAPKQVSKTVGVSKMIEIIQEYYMDTEVHVKEISSIIEVVLLGNGENIAYSVVYIVAGLFARTSNIVQISLLGLLKKVLNDRPGDVVSASSAVFTKHFLEASGLEMLLLLLSSGNYEVRSMCLSLIDSILSSNDKIPSFCTRKDIFAYISSIILPSPRLMSGSFKPLQLSLGSLQSYEKAEEDFEDTGKKSKGLRISEASKTFSLSNTKEDFLKFPSPKDDFGKYTSPKDMLKFPSPKEESIKFLAHKEDVGINPPPAPSSKKKISFMFPEVAKTDGKPGFFKKNIEIKTEKKDIEFAPQKKGFNFDFGNDADEINLPSLTERSLESEEEKREDFNLTLQPQKKSIKSFSQTRKFVPKLSENLNIDTDSINEKWEFGGEQGKVKNEAPEEETLMIEIKELASKCVKYMRGELESNTQDFFLLPINKFPPQSCRGQKVMDFSSVNPKKMGCVKAFDHKPEETKGHPEIIEEVSLDMSSSSFLTSPRKKEEEKVYHAILEMVLKRTIEGADILDDSDYIQSMAGLAILEDIVSKASSELKHKAMQDLMMLTKWNSTNASILSKDADWHYWLLDLLLECGEAQDTAVVISDIGHRLHTIVMKQAMLADEDGWKYLRRVIYWLESKKNAEKPRNIVKSLLEKLNEALQSNSMGCRPCLESTFWKNLITSAFLIEEFLLYSDDFVIYPDEASLLMTFIQLLDPIWPEVLFEDKLKDEEEHLQLIRCIESKEQGGFKADIQILVFEPPGELKTRGWFIKTILHLSCIALKSTNNAKPWLSVIDRIVKFILLVSETSKKQLNNAAIKAFTSCVMFTIGFLESFVFEDSGSVKATLVNILKYIFSIYVLSSKKQSQGGIKNIFKAGFQSLNVCEEAVMALTEKLHDDLEMTNLEEMMETSFEELQNVITNKTWQGAILDVFLPAQDQFESKSKAKLVSQSREKIAEKIGKDRDQLKKHSEEMNTKINEILQDKSSEKQADEDAKAKLRVLDKQESIRQRQHMWLKRKRLFTEWRGAWHVPHDLRLEPYQILDSESARPLLRVSSGNYAYLQGHTKREKPAIGFKAEFLAKDQPAIQDEEESDYNPEDDPLARSSLKGEVSKDALLLQVNVGLMQVLTTKYGTLQLLATKKEQKIKFTYDESIKEFFNNKIELFQYVPNNNKSTVKEWKVESIVNIIPHSFVMQHTAAEFFFDDGRSVLVQFKNYDDRLAFMSNLKKYRKTIPKLGHFKNHVPSKIVNESGMTEKWANWQISNFEYLMYLNFASGRSFHDLSQYPVMPWVLNIYDSDSLDLSLKTIYRDLAKNMGSLGSAERVRYFKERYQSYAKETSEPPFHFGSHYSNPGIVLSYLVRLFPYSEGAKELQGGRFDLPDRLFKSINEAFVSATDDISDVRELIPEFFCLPEFLINRDQHNFGRTQQGLDVNDVDLPGWARDAYDFIRINREALESDYVSENLHKWIDLIFGYKQQGLEAESSMNQYYYLTYENKVDLSKASDPAVRRGLETQIVQFGKTPSQLFFKPHQSRKPYGKVVTGTMVVSKEAQIKIYLPAHRKTFVKPLLFCNYYDVSERGIIKAKMFKDKEIVAVRNNGNIVKFSWWSEPMGECRTPFTCASNVEIQMVKDQKAGTVEYFDRSVEGLCAPLEIIQQGKVIIRGGFWDGRLSIKKTNTKEESTCRWNHHSTITCIDVDEQEKHVITGGKDGDVFLWQVEGEHLHPRWNFIDHDDQVTSVTISSQLHLFASCSLDGTCNLYSLRKGRLIRVIYLPNSSPGNIIKISPCAPSKVIVFSAAQGCVFSYSVNGAELCRVQEKSRYVSCALVVRDLHRKDYLVYGCDNGDIVVRNAGTLELVRRISLAAAAPVMTLMITSDLRFLLAGCADGELTVITDPSV